MPDQQACRAGHVAQANGKSCSHVLDTPRATSLNLHDDANKTSISSAARRSNDTSSQLICSSARKEQLPKSRRSTKVPEERSQTSITRLSPAPSVMCPTAATPRSSATTKKPCLPSTVAHSVSKHRSDPKDTSLLGICSRVAFDVQSGQSLRCATSCTHAWSPGLTADLLGSRLFTHCPRTWASRRPERRSDRHI